VNLRALIFRRPMLLGFLAAVLGLTALGGWMLGVATAAGDFGMPDAMGTDPFTWLVGGSLVLVVLIALWALRPLWGSARVADGGRAMRADRSHAALAAAARRLWSAPGSGQGDGRKSGVVRRPAGETSLRSYKVALDHAPMAIMISDADGRIEYVNEAFLAYSGYRREEVLGQTLRMFGVGRNSKALYRDMWETLRAGRSWRGELVNRRKCGSEFWEQLAISPLRDEFGEISHYMAVREDVTERKRREDGLRRLASIDSLTGVSNRRRLMDLAEREWRRATRFGLELSVLMLDIDRFKRINDIHGHATGDRAICLVARTCVAAVREIDVVGRYGGEEFVLLLPGTGLAGAREVAERLRAQVEELVLEIDGEEGTLTLTVSIGIAALGSADTLEQLLASADAALYRAKSSGRNRVVAVADCCEGATSP